jgi:hypothetical protein
VCLLVLQNEIYGEIPSKIDSDLKDCTNYARKNKKLILVFFSAWENSPEGKIGSEVK